MDVYKRAMAGVAAMGFTIAGKHLIKRLTVSQKCGAEQLLEVFATEDEVLVDQRHY